MVLSAKVPWHLAFAVPPIGRKGAITLNTAKVLPGMFCSWFKHARPAGATTDRAEDGKCMKERDGILNINVAIALMGPVIVVGRIAGKGHRKNITYMLMLMPCVKMSGHSKGRRH